MAIFPEDEVPQPWVETPLKESAALSRAAGCRVFLKLENLQPSGSFKSRGIGNLLRTHVQETLRSDPNRPIHFLSSSGGNAGLACVTAARTLGYPASVIVPRSTKPAMIAAIRAAGATSVEQIGATWAEADAYLRSSVLPTLPGAVYVPPFDDPRIWHGASTMVDEIHAQLDGGAPDAVICSVGGGGLLAGVARGVERNYGGEGGGVRVLAVETRGADSLSASLRAGELVTLPGISSIATSLGAVRVAREAFEVGRRPGVKSVVLDDCEAAMGCWRLADDERILVEASCGVSVALCYDGRLRRLIPGLTRQSKVVVVVCGGLNVSLEMLEEYKRTYAGAEKLATKDSSVPSTFSAPRANGREKLNVFDEASQ